MKHLFCVLCLLTFSLGWAQNKIIKGTVSDDKGVPLPRVSVLVKGTTQGTSTDFDGHYTIEISTGKTLVFSMVGFKSQEIKIQNQTVVDVRLKAGLALDEVVVIGYGTQKKSDITAAISSVKGEELEKTATANPIDALQGRVAGLTITHPGGSPGGQADISLRGIGSFGNHQPLFIIDGIPGDPNFLNNNDIASIEVLKDGSAAAIYGSRAANGVIIITTKSGKKGEPIIEGDMYYAWVSPTNRYDLLDADGYKKVHRMMYENAGIPQADWPAYLTKSSDINTNWQDEIEQRGIAQNYNVAIRGGGDNITYSLSGNFNDNQGTIIGSDYSKSSLHGKMGIHKGILDVNFNTTYAETQWQDYKFNLKDAYFQSPLLPVYDNQEEFGYALKKDGLPRFMNPVAADHYLKAYSKSQYFVGHVDFKLNLFKGFNYTARLSYRTSNDFDHSSNPPYWINFNDSPQLYPYVYNQRLNWKEKRMEHILNYKTTFGKHNLGLMAGATASSETSAWLNADVEGKTTIVTIENGQLVEREVPAGFLNPNFGTIDAGKGGTYSAGGSEYEYNRTSLFGRINYNYDERYLLQLSVRRDGSSKFGRDKRYGVFPSASVGWAISKEKFMDKVYWLDNLKLRASYGKLGNEQVLGYYGHLTLISTSNDRTGGYVQGSGASPWPGSIAVDLANRDLQWETVSSTNIGLDFGLLNNQLTGSFNYYINKTSDLLVTKEVAPSAGVNSPILNVGEIRNQGAELELTYRESAHKLKYSISGTLNTQKNKVLSLANSGQILYGTGLKYESTHIPTQTRVGEEVGAFYLYQAEGVFKSQQEVDQWNAAHNNMQPNAKPGDIRFADVNGDGVLNEDDKVYSGTGFPKLQYGLNVDLSYGQFDFSMFWQGVAGNKIYNGNLFELMGMDAGRNFLSDALNAWTPQNPNSNIPRAILGDPNGNNRASTRFLEDGDYLRLKRLQVGYTLPQSLVEKLYIKSFRVYFGVENILTLTNYSGLDPEIGNVNVLDTGVDRMKYPQTQKILMGLQISL